MTKRKAISNLAGFTQKSIFCFWVAWSKVVAVAANTFSAPRHGPSALKKKKAGMAWSISVPFKNLVRLYSQPGSKIVPTQQSSQWIAKVHIRPGEAGHLGFWRFCEEQANLPNGTESRGNATWDRGRGCGCDLRKLAADSDRATEHQSNCGSNLNLAGIEWRLCPSYPINY